MGKPTGKHEHPDIENRLAALEAGFVTVEAQAAQASQDAADASSSAAMAENSAVGASNAAVEAQASADAAAASATQATANAALAVQTANAAKDMAEAAQETADGNTATLAGHRVTLDDHEGRILLLEGEDPPDPPDPPDPVGAWLVDPAFSSDALTPVARSEYQRIVATHSSPRLDPAIESRAKSGDVYEIGRHVYRHVVGLMAAFRRTGSVELLHLLVEVSEWLKVGMRPGGTDGTDYRHFLTYAGSSPSQTYLWHHTMDQALTARVLAALWWVFDKNRAEGPAVAASADFWRDFILQDFEPMWRTYRADQGYSGAWDPTWTYLWRKLTHPFVALGVFWRLTGELTGEQWRHDEADRIVSVFRAEMHAQGTPLGEGIYWDHGVEDNSQKDNHQHAGYSEYTFQTLFEWTPEWFGVDPEGAELAVKATRSVATFVTDVPPGYADFGYDLDAEDEPQERWARSRFAIWAYSIEGATMDDSGRIFDALTSVRASYHDEAKMQLTVGAFCRAFDRGL